MFRSNVKLSAIINQSMFSNDRAIESSFLLNKYPNHRPVYIRYNDKISRHLIPSDQPYSFLLFLIRRSRHIDPTVAVMTLIETLDGKHIVPPCGEKISEIFNIHKHDDGFLYIDFIKENVFG
jgi:hypothetical protein